MIEAMDQAEIAKSAVVQASSAYAFDNSYVAAAVAAYPKRFTGVFAVDLLAPDAVDKMKCWIAQGLTGMRLYTAGTSLPEQTVWFADPKTFPAWTFAGEAGIPVCMQMRVEGFVARDSLGFLPQQDRDWIFEKTALTLYPALKDK